MGTRQSVQQAWRELPNVMRYDRDMREWVLRVTRERYADKEETESRFDRLLDELRREREESTRRWEEQNRKWDEQARRWEEHQRNME